MGYVQDGRAKQTERRTDRSSICLLCLQALWYDLWVFRKTFTPATREENGRKNRTSLPNYSRAQSYDIVRISCLARFFFSHRKHIYQRICRNLEKILGPIIPPKFYIWMHSPKIQFLSYFIWIWNINIVEHLQKPNKKWFHLAKSLVSKVYIVKLTYKLKMLVNSIKVKKTSLS